MEPSPHCMTISTIDFEWWTPCRNWVDTQLPIMSVKTCPWSSITHATPSVPRWTPGTRCNMVTWSPLPHMLPATYQHTNFTLIYDIFQPSKSVIFENLEQKQVKLQRRNPSILALADGRDLV